MDDAHVTISPTRNTLIVLLALTALIMTGMLYFGIRFKGFRPANQVRWLSAGPGIQFSRFGIAFTEAFFPQPAEEHSPGLTIEMAVQPVLSKYPDFRFILSVHGGNDAQQLVIGQWRTSLVIMQGDDYDGKEGVPKIYIDLSAQGQGPRLVSITSDASGTRVLLDGQPVKTNPNLHLRYPAGKARLVVGNSVTARHPWNGSMFGLAFYQETLDNEQVAAHYRNWREAGSMAAVGSASPRILYLFDEGRGDRVVNRAANDFDLKVPAWVTVLQKRFLEPPGKDQGPHSKLFQDMLVNLVGFIPLGLVLCAVAVRMGAGLRRCAWQVSVLVSFLFSFGLELAQVWIPSRSSSMLDLLLNTLGAGIGAAVCMLNHRVARKSR